MYTLVPDRLKSTEVAEFLWEGNWVVVHTIMLTAVYSAWKLVVRPERKVHPNEYTGCPEGTYSVLAVVGFHVGFHMGRERDLRELYNGKCLLCSVAFLSPVCRG